MVKSRAIYQSMDQLESIPSIRSPIDYMNKDAANGGETRAQNDLNYLSHRIPTRELKKRERQLSKQAQVRILNPTKFAVNKLKPYQSR